MMQINQKGLGNDRCLKATRRPFAHIFQTDTKITLITAILLALSKAPHTALQQGHAVKLKKRKKVRSVEGGRRFGEVKQRGWRERGGGGERTEASGENNKRGEEMEMMVERKRVERTTR